MLSWHHTGFHYILVTGFIQMTKLVLAIWPITLSEPVPPRKEWSIFQQKNQLTVLPKWFIPARTESPGKFSMLWTGWLNCWFTFPTDTNKRFATTVSIQTNQEVLEKRLMLMIISLLLYPMRSLPKNLCEVRDFLMNNKISCKGIWSQNRFTQHSQTIYTFSEINWLHSQEYSHPGGNLDHTCLLQNDLPSSRIWKPVIFLKHIFIVEPHFHCWTTTVFHFYNAFWNVARLCLIMHFYKCRG